LIFVAARKLPEEIHFLPLTKAIHPSIPAQIAPANLGDH